MIKTKKCKGMGRAIGYKGCGKESMYRKYGLCPSCLSDWLFDTEDGKIYMERQLLYRVQKPRKDLEKAEVEKKERDNLSRHLADTQSIVNKYVRLRDQGKPCISSGIAWIKDFDAGHCFSVKQFSALRFDLDNIHGQSINSNRFKEGDEVNYLLNIPNRIGEERTKALIKRAELSKKYVKKWTRHELKEIQNQIKQLIKELA
jgi:hypothetical protein